MQTKGTNNKECAYCKCHSSDLIKHHLFPKSLQSSDKEIIYVCHNCHYLLDKHHVSEFEFNNYIAQLMDASNEYENIRLESQLTQNVRSYQGTTRELRYIADITATSKKLGKILIEGKNSSSFTSSRFKSAISQIEKYKELSDFDVYILLFPGLLTNEQRETLEDHNIELWDLKNIASNFKKEIDKIPHPIFQSMFQLFKNNNIKTVEESFISELKNCPSGKKNWVKYQKLTGKILEHLFCPPLETPISESGDLSGTNRRDFIIPNYSTEGFWKFIRNRYSADYNMTDTITKERS